LNLMLSRLRQLVGREMKGYILFYRVRLKPVKALAILSTDVSDQVNVLLMLHIRFEERSNHVEVY